MELARPGTGAAALDVGDNFRRGWRLVRTILGFSAEVGKMLVGVGHEAIDLYSLDVSGCRV